MPDGLYERDVLAWSQQQADLLRRLERGERVNNVDWTNVAEEIEDVGLSELHAVESFLNLIVLHLMKLRAFPNSLANPHWQAETVTFQRSAKRRFTPSMRQRLDLRAAYADAFDAMRAGKDRKDTLQPWPATSPFTLDELMDGEPEDLLDRMVPSSTEGSAA